MLKARENERAYAISKFAVELLDVSDSMKRAVDTIPAYMETYEATSGVEKVL